MIQKTPANTKRIEYIDALRGFTMLLVVMGHVTVFINGYYITNEFSLTSIFTQFRMPLFFFISGFVLYKANILWNVDNIIGFLKKKVTVGILSPLLFMFVCCVVTTSSFTQYLIDENKGGYWFTFVLFFYYIIYIIVCKISQLCKMRSTAEDAMLLIIGCALYILADFGIMAKMGIKNVILDILCFPHWNFFLYLVIGTRVRKHFCKFEELLESKYFTLVCVVVLFTALVFGSAPFGSTIVKNLAFQTSAVCTTFALFRKHQNAFSSNKRLGRIAQYVGRHTLDIYLLHYFFVYTNMYLTKSIIDTYPGLLTDFVVSIVLSAIIIALCLALSLVLRLNPLMAHWLFGAKTLSYRSKKMMKQ